MTGDILRIRRKRRLMAALRWAVAQQALVPPAALVALRERLDAIGASQGRPSSPEADLPERLARIDHGGVVPPEVVAMLAAILTPLLSLSDAARSIQR
jgi:hypothetical protein